MEFRSHVTSQGLTVIAECNPRSQVTAAGVFVRAGARDETPDVGGVSHFLEHMVFKGTRTRTAEQVNLRLDELGAYSNARTSEDCTIYHAAVLPEFQTPIVELLTDLMRPVLRHEDFETEKQVILEEILMYEDQPPYGGYERLMAEYFGAHPLGQSILGTTQSVGGLTPEQMRRYFASRYNPNNMAIVAAGKVDFARLVDDVERSTWDWIPQPVARSITPVQGQSGFHTSLKPQSTQQYFLQLVRSPAAEDPLRFAAGILATILGDDSGSRLYWSLVDSGRAEVAAMATYEFEGAGVLLTYLCCAPEDAEENLDELERLQRVTTNEGVTARELQLAKSKIISEIFISSERAENRMFGIGGNWLKQRSYLPAEDVAKLFDAVTLDDVHQVLSQYSLTGGTRLAVGPLENLGQEESPSATPRAVHCLSGSPGPVTGAPISPV